MAGPELSRRLGEALGTRQVTLDERQTVRTAAIAADTFEDLPPAVKALVEEIESRPGWLET